MDNLPIYYDHLIHNIILVVYAIIVAQFLHLSKGKGVSYKKRSSILFLCVIFILCGVTRALMDLYITGVITAILNTIFLIVCFYFVCTNKIASIVEPSGDGKV